MNLQNLGVQEMSLKETRDVDGGILICLALAIWYHSQDDHSCVDDWNDMVDGFNDGSGASCE